MMQVFCYMRISTKEERELQRYQRQEKAINKYLQDHGLTLSAPAYQDDSSGASFNRPEWKKLESLLLSLGKDALVVFKDLSRFTRQREAGYKKYMELLNAGVNMVFIDNPLLDTDTIKEFYSDNKARADFLVSFTLDFICQLLINIELSRAEKEREILIQRIKDGLAASTKKTGRQRGQTDKLTPALREDINKYLQDRKIRDIDVCRKHHICYNTLHKYINIIQRERDGESKALEGARK